MSRATELHVYSRRLVGAFILSPLLLMAISLPWGWWPFLFAILIWLACLFNMLTGWLPRKRQ